MHAVQRKPRLREPLLEIGYRRRIVIIEVRPGCEHFNAIEPVGTDLEQVIPGQPIVVVEVRRHPELTLGHKANHSF